MRKSSETQLGPTSEEVTLRRHLLACTKSGRDPNIDELQRISLLVQAGSVLRDDKEVMIVLLKDHNGDLLQNASDRLRDDEDVVRESCMNGNWAGNIRWASARLMGDLEFLKSLRNQVPPSRRSEVLRGLTRDTVQKLLANEQR